jgi:hypothetical protein
MFVFYKYLYSVFICYIMIIPCCFTKVFKLCILNPMYYKCYCNILTCPLSFVMIHGMQIEKETVGQAYLERGNEVS